MSSSLLSLAIWIPIVGAFVVFDVDVVEIILIVIAGVVRPGVGLHLRILPLVEIDIGGGQTPGAG
ncbi:MAG: hypothetical protein N2690_12605, partial [Rhodocyclaceae bacterium]|nr:hypothetical protein [Rhodocyclaceae bacterium]